MVFHCPALKRGLLVACATMGIVLPSLAQRHGQPIIFSTEPDTVSNATPTLAPRAPELPDFIKDIQPPSLPNASATLTRRALVISPAQWEAAQQELDRQKNWTLLTPAEILGVPTLENTFGLSERNAAGEKKNQTALERYFDRQQHSENVMMTNEAAAINASADWSLQNREQPANFSGAQKNSFFSAMPDNHLEPNQDATTAWPKALGSQTVAPVTQTQEQLEAAQAAARSAAEDFQKLLQPGLAMPAAKPATASAQLPTAPDSLFKPPANSIGNSFTPVSSGVMMPQGVTPLFGPASDKNPSTTPVTPEWKRKLPPWMSSGAPNQNF